MRTSTPHPTPSNKGSNRLTWLCRAGNRPSTDIVAWRSDAFGFGFGAGGTGAHGVASEVHVGHGDGGDVIVHVDVHGGGCRVVVAQR